jgi:diaminohydroxyphosphoribosylaminopyrimidine deaminase / 5-amino-6-(5-phosphoribosylamino)uracil reductase
VTASLPRDDLMRECFTLARQGAGAVEPNPQVGALVVRDGEIVGRGWHRQYGGAHAEIEALRDAGDRARGADVYVSLEPCSTHGKTPPCTEALVRAQVRRVIYGTSDPNPAHAGAGLHVLAAAGIAIAGPILEGAARSLIAPFMSYLAGRRPWVLAKWAQSLDGKIATSAGESQWITGEEARRRSHLERARADGILVGVGTVLADDPELTVRLAPPLRPLCRFVLDTHLRTPPIAKLATSGAAPTVIFATREAIAAREAAFDARRVELIAITSGPDGRLDLGAVLEWLRRRGTHRLLVEGGPRVLGSFVAARAIDRVHVYVAPKILGDAGARSAIDGPLLARLAGALDCEPLALETCGPDALLSAAVRKIVL